MFKAMTTIRGAAMRRSLLAATVCAAVLAPTALPAGAKDDYSLKGEVYASGFKIEMKNRANRKLTSVRAGTYRIKIEDMATIHNSRLVGPGVNRATSVRGKIETIWTVKLKKGTYAFVCDPHASMMRGTFKVT